MIYGYIPVSEANRMMDGALNEVFLPVHVGREPLDGGSDTRWEIDKGPRDDNPNFVCEKGAVRFYFSGIVGVSVAADCLKIGGRTGLWYQVMPETQMTLDEANAALQEAWEAEQSVFLISQNANAHQMFGGHLAWKEGPPFPQSELNADNTPVIHLAFYEPDEMLSLVGVKYIRIGSNDANARFIAVVP
jgi:hypothetical protein